MAYLLTGLCQDVGAQVYSGNVVGYINCVFLSGSNLFNNPLQDGGNSLSELFNSGPVPPPEGTTISLWDPVSRNFDYTSTFTNGEWSDNLTMPPGTGVLLVAPTSFTNTIVGDVLDHTGFLFNGLEFNLPSVFAGPPGLYLVGDKSPIVDIGTDIFLNIIGRLPYAGEQVIQLSGVCTYLGNGHWDSIPTLRIGQSAFLRILAAPAPILDIVDAGDQVTVSWPDSLQGWSLQTCNGLGTFDWMFYYGPMMGNSVTLPKSAGRQFFRLVHP